MQTTIAENQKIMWLPMNDITSTIEYDTRTCVSAPVKQPIVWKVSKVDNTNPNGIVHYTLAQERWNEHTDAFEYEHEEEKDDFSPIFDPKRKVIGMYADYYISNITPTEPKENTPNNIYGKITYKANPEIRVGGNFKKFTLTFYDGNEEIKVPEGEWSYEINGADCSSILDIDDQREILRLKFVGDSEYIGSVITITYTTTDNIKTSLDVEVIGL